MNQEERSYILLKGFSTFVKQRKIPAGEVPVTIHYGFRAFIGQEVCLIISGAAAVGIVSETVDSKLTLRDVFVERSGLDATVWEDWRVVEFKEISLILRASTIEKILKKEGKKIPEKGKQKLKNQVIIPISFQIYPSEPCVVETGREVLYSTGLEQAGNNQINLFDVIYFNVRARKFSKREEFLVSTRTIQSIFPLLEQQGTV